jgi:hypothetical protein
MKNQLFSLIRFVQPENVPGDRSRKCGARRATRVLAAVLAIGLAVLPSGSAFAGEQVLEIPQVGSVPAKVPSARKPHGTTYAAGDAYASATPDSYVDPAATASGPTDPPDTVAANDNSYPPDPNVGSINDYQNQQGENAQPGIGLGGGARRNEPQTSMTTNLIVGGLIVGLMALEIASHHHHR